MGVIAAVAEFERDLLIERTQSGLKRAKDQGRTLGRPAVLSNEQQQEVRTRRAGGASLEGVWSDQGRYPAGGKASPKSKAGRVDRLLTRA